VVVVVMGTVDRVDKRLLVYLAIERIL
jgi:hypothetical protein